MIKIYGIKTCGSVKKAMAFFQLNNIEFEFVDFKKTKPTMSELNNWLQYVDTKKLLNTKGTTYKKLNLSQKALKEQDIVQHLLNEPLLIKRPVIELSSNVIVGYDEELYKNLKWH